MFDTLCADVDACARSIDDVREMLQQARGTTGWEAEWAQEVQELVKRCAGHARSAIVRLILTLSRSQRRRLALAGFLVIRPLGCRGERTPYDGHLILRLTLLFDPALFVPQGSCLAATSRVHPLAGFGHPRADDGASRLGARMAAGSPGDDAACPRDAFGHLYGCDMSRSWCQGRFLCTREAASRGGGAQPSERSRPSRLFVTDYLAVEWAVERPSSN